MVFFFCYGSGREEGGLAIGKVKKCPVDTFLARGRVHGWVTASRRDVDSHPLRRTVCRDVFAFPAEGKKNASRVLLYRRQGKKVSGGQFLPPLSKGYEEIW